MGIYRGEHQVAKIVQVPSPEEEDDKRLLRCRGNLLRDRIQHMNRIRGLLNLQGVRHIDPNRSNLENELVNLRTGDGRSFPRQLMNEVRREGKLLGTVVRMLKEVEAEIAGMIRDERKRRHPAQRGQNHPIRRRLVKILARFTDFRARKNELLPVSSTWARFSVVLASGPTCEEDPFAD